jgi:hypothetical protein
VGFEKPFERVCGNDEPLRRRQDVIDWLCQVIDGKIEPSMAQLKSSEILCRMCGWNEPDKLDVSGLTVSQEVEDNFNEVFGMPS